MPFRSLHLTVPRSLAATYRLSVHDYVGAVLTHTVTRPLMRAVAVAVAVHGIALPIPRPFVLTCTEVLARRWPFTVNADKSTLQRPVRWTTSAHASGAMPWAVRALELPPRSRWARRAD